jgi:hypothetical protein
MSTKVPTYICLCLQRLQSISRHLPVFELRSIRPLHNSTTRLPSATHSYLFNSRTLSAIKSHIQTRLRGPTIRTMAKRRRSSPPAEDEDWSGGEISNPTTDSEYDDVSSRRKSKYFNSTKRKSGPTRKKPKVLKIDASPRSSKPQELGAVMSLHSKSTHAILSPVPVRIALLDWFKTVHDTRGMPWRKPYDPTLSPERRAQRAYEVRVSADSWFMIGTSRSYSYLIGLDFRDHVTTNASCHSRTLL